MKGTFIFISSTVLLGLLTLPYLLTLYFTYLTGTIPDLVALIGESLNQILVEFASGLGGFVIYWLTSRSPEGTTDNILIEKINRFHTHLPNDWLLLRSRFRRM